MGREKEESGRNTEALRARYFCHPLDVPLMFFTLQARGKNTPRTKGQRQQQVPEGRGATGLHDGARAEKLHRLVHKDEKEEEDK
jgi:hypothetical protein